MSEKNPELVLKAATGAQEPLPVRLHPLTISRYAWLERLDSPFLAKGSEFKVGTVVPTLWAMAADKEELRAAGRKDIEQVKEDALEWADDKIGVDQLPAVIEAVGKALLETSKAAPSGGDPEKN